MEESCKYTLYGLPVVTSKTAKEMIDLFNKFPSAEELVQWKYLSKHWNKIEKENPEVLNIIKCEIGKVEELFKNDPRIDKTQLNKIVLTNILSAITIYITLDYQNAKNKKALSKKQ